VIPPLSNPGYSRNSGVALNRVIASKYCLLYELGHGTMGTVWAAEHLSLRSHVAVKLINPALAASPDAVRRFEAEARAAAALRSPHVVQVLDFGIEGTPFLVMELLKGENLAQRLARRGPLPWLEAWTLVSQLGRAMTRAHAQGIVHRDLKPANLFLTEDDAPFFVKVLDFGIAKALRGSDLDISVLLTQAGALLGTPLYMSPEQTQGRPVDARSDLWSMAIITFEALTGRLPYTAQTLPDLLRAICTDPMVVPSKIAPVPPGFDTWFTRATARDPAQRFPDVQSLLAPLESLLATRPSQIPPPPVDDTLVDQPPTLPARLHISGYAPTPSPATLPSAASDRRSEPRMPSSIPAGINGQRDFRHTALIHNTSRTGALLITSHACKLGDLLHLSFQMFGHQHGAVVPARVMRVAGRGGDLIWRYEVGVQFEKALGEELLAEIERRAAVGSGKPSV
jgi:serine/threonine protein kinase